MKSISVLVKLNDQSKSSITKLSKHLLNLYGYGNNNDTFNTFSH